MKVYYKFYAGETLMKIVGGTDKNDVMARFKRNFHPCASYPKITRILPCGYGENEVLNFLSKESKKTYYGERK